jgi:type II secretory pathway component PulF
LELAKDGSDSNERTAKDMAKYKNYEEVMELLRHPPTPTTVILMTVSQFVPSHYISLLGVISAMVILGFICFRSESRARAWRWIQMHLPLFGKMNRKP